MFIIHEEYLKQLMNLLKTFLKKRPKFLKKYVVLRITFASLKRHLFIMQWLQEVKFGVFKKATIKVIFLQFCLFAKNLRSCFLN